MDLGVWAYKPPLKLLSPSHTTRKGTPPTPCCESFVAQLCPTLCDPVDYSPSGSSVHGILQARYWRGLTFPPPGDLPKPVIKPRSPELQADSLPSEPPGKSMNNAVSSLAFLQGIFLTQELNQGLQHCRLTLYQLSYLSPALGLTVAQARM